MSPLRSFLPAFPAFPYLSLCPPKLSSAGWVRAGISSAVLRGPIRAFRTRWAREQASSLSLCVWMWVLAWERVQVGL